MVRGHIPTYRGLSNMQTYAARENGEGQGGYKRVVCCPGLGTINVKTATDEEGMVSNGVPRP